MRVIYFGIFDPEFSRNKVFREALLAQGVEVEIMSERGKGISKYVRLAQRLRAASDYDAVIVGYPGYTSAPIAKMFSKAPVIFDALSTYWEGQVLSRDAYHGNPLGLLWCRFIDWLSVKLADKVLVETEAQQQFFMRRFSTAEDKVRVVYTGVDEAVFGGVVAAPDREQFMVLFRGRITDEAGVEHVVRAAKLLERSGITFKLIGFGWAKPIERVRQTLAELKPENLTWIDRQLPQAELIEEMRTASVSLGQFGGNERLERTIPHKAFEAMLLGIPYLTADAAGIREAFTDGESAVFVQKENPQALADALLALKGQPKKLLSLAAAAQQEYEKRFSKAALGATLVGILQSND